MAAVCTAILSIAGVKIVEELTGYATNAAIGAFIEESRVINLGPDSDAFTVLERTTLVAGADDKTDLDVFQCDGPGPKTRTRAVRDTLSTSSHFGRIRLSVIKPDERALPFFDGLTTVVYDADHPERDEILPLWKLLPRHEAVQFIPNSASQTGWLLSIFIC